MGGASFENRSSRSTGRRQIPGSHVRAGPNLAPFDDSFAAPGLQSLVGNQERGCYVRDVHSVKTSSKFWCESNRPIFHASHRRISSSSIPWLTAPGSHDEPSPTSFRIERPPPIKQSTKATLSRGTTAKETRPGWRNDRSNWCPLPLPKTLAMTLSSHNVLSQWLARRWRHLS